MKKMYKLILMITMGVLLCVLLKNCFKKNGVSDDVGKTYKNAYVLYSDGKSIYFYYNGDYIEFKCRGVKGYENVIADIKYNEKEVEKVIVKSDSINGKLISIDESFVEVSGYGKIPIEKNVKIYDITEGIAKRDKSELIVGYDKYRFVVANGELSAVIIEENVVSNNIRVLIKNSDYTKNYHERVTLYSDKGMSIDDGKEVKDCVKQQDVTYTIEAMQPGERIVVTPKDNGKIGVKSVSRAQGVPMYSGVLEVTRTQDGFTIVNDVALEEYLRYVVPSEMPASYEIEALKAQAVCARTYAYSHILSGGLKEYGAHVDDSVTYQVYNNCNSNPSTDKAVAQTYGMVLKCGDSLAATNYYSTSCGYGGDESIWGNESIPANSLINHSINSDNEVLKLDNENSFYEFISKQNENDFDYEYSYYRWNGNVNLSELENKLSIGKILDIKVSKRLENGVADKVLFVGQTGKKEISSQYSIRQILGGNVCDLKNKNEEKINMNMLPSGFFVFDVIKDNSGVKECLIYGGGLGHGVGMSQNGANSMAKQSYTYDRILEFFFANSKAEGIY